MANAAKMALAMRMASIRTQKVEMGRLLAD
jgi:hypothetical protein